MSNIRIRNLIFGGLVVITGGVLCQFLTPEPVWSLAAYVATMQVVLTGYFWYKLKNTLEF